MKWPGRRRSYTCSCTLAGAPGTITPVTPKRNGRKRMVPPTKVVLQAEQITSVHTSLGIHVDCYHTWKFIMHTHLTFRSAMHANLIQCHLDSTWWEQNYKLQWHFSSICSVCMHVLSALICNKFLWGNLLNW